MAGRAQGNIYLETFEILGVQNHYPSGGAKQSCGAVIRIRGYERKKDDDSKVSRIVDVKFKNFHLRKNKKGELYELVPAPKLKRGKLHVEQPASLLPLWQMVLTTLEPDSYYITYKHKSHAFLQPVGGVSHRVGGVH